MKHFFVAIAQLCEWDTVTELTQARACNLAWKLVRSNGEKSTSVKNSKLFFFLLLLFSFTNSLKNNYFDFTHKPKTQTRTKTHFIEWAFSNVSRDSMEKSKIRNISINYFEAWECPCCVYRAEARENVSRRLILSHNLSSRCFRGNVSFFFFFHMLRLLTRSIWVCRTSPRRQQVNRVETRMLRKMLRLATSWHFGV